MIVKKADWLRAVALGLILLAAGAVSATGASANEEALAARVNGVGITMKSLSEKMTDMGGRDANGTPSAVQDPDTLRKKALDRLIFEELAWQYARSRGMKADPAEVDAQVAKYRTDVGGGEELERRLAGIGMTEASWRDHIGRIFVLRKIFKTEIDDKVAVTDDDIRKEYEKNIESFTIPEKATVTEIIFFLDPDAPESEQTAEKIVKGLRADKSLDAALLPLDGTFVVRQLELNHKDHAQLMDEVRNLEPGGLSRSIKSPDSLHMFQLKKYVPPKPYPLEQFKAFLENKMKEEARSKRVTDWESELKKGASIEVYSKEGSK